MTRALPFAVLLLAACGPATPKPDGGTPIDTSCGLDCAAQATFGLLEGTCFEYTDSAVAQNPATLGAKVLPVFTLEGDVKVMPVEYRAGGQLRMRDSLGLVNGELRLMRREFAGGNSVSWKDAQGNIVGVPWLRTNTGPNETLEVTRSASTVQGGGAATGADATHRVSTQAAGSTDLNTPAQTWTEGLTLLFNDVPGTDTRRVFVKDVGFVGFSNDFALTAGTATQFKLQKVRNMNATDGGTVVDCGFGGP